MTRTFNTAFADWIESGAYGGRRKPIIKADFTFGGGQPVGLPVFQSRMVAGYHFSTGEVITGVIDWTGNAHFGTAAGSGASLDSSESPFGYLNDSSLLLDGGADAYIELDNFQPDDDFTFWCWVRPVDDDGPMTVVAISEKLGAPPADQTHDYFAILYERSGANSTITVRLHGNDVTMTRSKHILPHSTWSFIAVTVCTTSTPSTGSDISIYAQPQGQFTEVEADQFVAARLSDEDLTDIVKVNPWTFGAHWGEVAPASQLRRDHWDGHIDEALWFNECADQETIESAARVRVHSVISGSKVLFDRSPSIDSIKTVRREIEPITNRFSGGSEMELVLKNDDLIEALFDNFSPRSATVEVSLGCEDIAIGEFELMFFGILDEIFPTAEGIACRILDWNGLLLERPIDINVVGFHPLEVIELVLEDFGVEASRYVAASLEPSQYTKISHFNTSRTSEPFWMAGPGRTYNYHATAHPSELKSESAFDICQRLACLADGAFFPREDDQKLRFIHFDSLTEDLTSDGTWKKESIKSPGPRVKTFSEFTYNTIGIPLADTQMWDPELDAPQLGSAPQNLQRDHRDRGITLSLTDESSAQSVALPNHNQLGGGPLRRLLSFVFDYISDFLRGFSTSRNDVLTLAADEYHVNAGSVLGFCGLSISDADRVANTGVQQAFRKASASRPVYLGTLNELNFWSGSPSSFALFAEIAAFIDSEWTWTSAFSGRTRTLIGYSGGASQDLPEDSRFTIDTAQRGLFGTTVVANKDRPTFNPYAPGWGAGATIVDLTYNVYHTKRCLLLTREGMKIYEVTTLMTEYKYEIGDTVKIDYFFEDSPRNIPFASTLFKSNRRWRILGKKEDPLRGVIDWTILLLPEDFVFPDLRAEDAPRKWVSINHVLNRDVGCGEDQTTDGDVAHVMDDAGHFSQSSVGLVVTIGPGVARFKDRHGVSTSDQTLTLTASKRHWVFASALTGDIRYVTKDLGETLETIDYNVHEALIWEFTTDATTVDSATDHRSCYSIDGAAIDPTTLPSSAACDSTATLTVTDDTEHTLLFVTLDENTAYCLQAKVVANYGEQRETFLVRCKAFERNADVFVYDQEQEVSNNRTSLRCYWAPGSDRKVNLHFAGQAGQDVKVEACENRIKVTDALAPREYTQSWYLNRGAGTGDYIDFSAHRAAIFTGAFSECTVYFCVRGPPAATGGIFAFDLASSGYVEAFLTSAGAIQFKISDGVSIDLVQTPTHVIKIHKFENFVCIYNGNEIAENRMMIMQEIDGVWVRADNAQSTTPPASLTPGGTNYWFGRNHLAVYGELKVAAYAFWLDALDQDELGEITQDGIPVSLATHSSAPEQEYHPGNEATDDPTSVLEDVSGNNYDGTPVAMSAEDDIRDYPQSIPFILSDVIDLNGLDQSIEWSGDQYTSLWGNTTVDEVTIILVLRGAPGASASGEFLFAGKISGGSESIWLKEDGGVLKFSVDNGATFITITIATVLDDTNYHALVLTYDGGVGYGAWKRELGVDSAFSDAILASSGTPPATVSVASGGDRSWVIGADTSNANNWDRNSIPGQVPKNSLRLAMFGFLRDRVLNVDEMDESIADRFGNLADIRQSSYRTDITGVWWPLNHPRDLARGPIYDHLGGLVSTTHHNLKTAARRVGDAPQSF